MECPVCFNKYTVEKYAMKLGCSHIVCNDCTQILLKDEIVKCPICLKPSQFQNDISKCKTIEGMIVALRENKPALNNLNEKFSILVRNLKGNIAEIDVRKSETVTQLKEKVRNIENVEVNSQWLLFNGKALDNPSTLESVGLKNGDLVYVVIRSFGG